MYFAFSPRGMIFAKGNNFFYASDNPSSRVFFPGIFGLLHQIYNDSVIVAC